MPLPALLHGRRLGRWLGWLVVAGALAFVAERLWQGEVWTLARAQLAPLLAAVLAGALIYGVASLLLSAAWRQLLAGEPQAGPPLGYHAVYGRTQIAKYLPGNVFHFVGRQVLGRTLGHSQRALALASVLEAVLLAALAAVLAAPLAGRWLGGWALLLPLAGAAALVLACAAARLLPAGWAPPPAARVLQAAAAYGAFFAVAGGLVWLLASPLAGEARLPPLTAVSALALAWVAGLRDARELRRPRRPRGGADAGARRPARRRSGCGGRARAAPRDHARRRPVLRERAAAAAAGRRPGIDK